jgi:hypothetical protein
MKSTQIQKFNVRFDHKIFNNIIIRYLYFDLMYITAKNTASKKRGLNNLLTTAKNRHFGYFRIKVYSSRLSFILIFDTVIYTQPKYCVNNFFFTVNFI